MLARLQVECLRALLALANLEADLFALAQILEVYLRRHARAMEEHLVAAVVRHDESEPLVAHDALDRPKHRLSFRRSPRGGRADGGRPPVVRRPRCRAGA